MQISKKHFPASGLSPLAELVHFYIGESTISKSPNSQPQSRQNIRITFSSMSLPTVFPATASEAAPIKIPRNPPIAVPMPGQTKLPMAAPVLPPAVAATKPPAPAPRSVVVPRVVTIWLQ